MACIVRPIATRRRTCVSSAVTGFRCESGALCSSSQPKVPKQLLSRASPLLMTGLHGMCTLGPQPDTEEEGSALDFPEEYVRATPSRRPDIFPDLKEPKQPMPKRMPGDPELPDEEDEEEQRKKNPGEPGTNPDEEDDENLNPKKNDDEEGE